MPIWRDKREKKRGRARSSSPGRRTDRPGRGSHLQSTTDHQSPTSRTGYSAPGIYLPSTKPVDLTFLGVEITWYRVSKIPALVEVFPSRGRDSLTWEFSSHRFSLRESELDSKSRDCSFSLENLSSENFSHFTDLWPLYDSEGRPSHFSPPFYVRITMSLAH